MGMDVYGKKPAAETGEYFRASVWSWHPVWDYCETIAPHITAKVENAHSNDGDGLNAADSRRLAGILRAEIDSGRTAAYLAMQKSVANAMPDEPCELCNGTGTRTRPIPGDPTWQPEPGKCNGCSNTGKIRPWATHYGTDLDHLTEFASFLADCGGFRIC